MNTPICDFVKQYAESRMLRLHMPGHKGIRLLGPEELDITEIHGADSLYEADGIIRQSEENASALFGSHTLYSTEGSSLCIRAMLAMVRQYAAHKGMPFRLLAGRNAHKTFISGVALLDAEVQWILPRESDSYLSCAPNGQELEARLSDPASRPTAVYLTSPDYLGGMIDLREVAKICHRHGVLLLVDNAHGAYLRFLPQSLHPIDLGADLCCDSAHKTLPALTGAAYLHISHETDPFFKSHAKDALALFGSTSPSYLILQSLDLVNRYLAEGYREKLEELSEQIQIAKVRLTAHGYRLCGSEPLKITLAAKSYGYTGEELAAELERVGIVCELADPDYTVFMLTPQIGKEGLNRLTDAFLAIPKRESIKQQPPFIPQCEEVLTPRQAMLAPHLRLPVEESVGRILASPSVGCPPAVPIVISGERISPEAANCFAYYGIRTCTVVEEA